MGLLSKQDKNEINPEVEVSEDKWPAIDFEHAAAGRIAKSKKKKKGEK